MTDQILEATRRCPQCGLRRDPGLFLSDARRALCEPCRTKKSEQARARRYRVGPSLARASHLWSKYRMTLEDYDALLEQQDHRCAICGIHEDEIAYSRGGRRRHDGAPPAEAFRLVVDHCHTGGQVRGLLCNGCNALIGHAKESEQVMLAAIEYLKRDPSFASMVQPLFAS